MLLINTRPADRAAELTQCLQQAGIEVFELPLLSLEAQPWTESLAALYLQLIHTQVIVVVSPTAVNVGMQYLAKSAISIEQLSHITWIAVGVKTAQQLAQYGISSHIPLVENSEGMLQLACLKNLAPHSKIAFWRGEGGRQFMMDQLQQQGMQILNFLLYTRTCPLQSVKLKSSLLAALKAQPRYIVLISSEASWLYWQQIMHDQVHICQQATYLVLGERVKNILCSEGYFNILQLDNLNPHKVLEKIL